MPAPSLDSMPAPGSQQAPASTYPGVLEFRRGSPGPPEAPLLPLGSLGCEGAAGPGLGVTARHLPTPSRLSSVS